VRRSDFLKALIVVPLAAKAVVLAESMVSRCLFVGGDDGYKTIQGALNDAKSGDTVYVRPVSTGSASPWCQEIVRS